MGTKTGTVSRLEQRYENQTETFETDGQNLRVERELAGFGDRYGNMQPSSMPSVEKIYRKEVGRLFLV